VKLTVPVVWNAVMFVAGLGAGVTLGRIDAVIVTFWSTVEGVGKAAIEVVVPAWLTVTAKGPETALALLLELPR
jgi:hypothetical protein